LRGLQPPQRMAEPALEGNVSGEHPTERPPPAGEEPDESHLLRTPRKRKRRKRLSIITSPGMLTAPDGGRTLPPPRGERSEPALLESDALLTDPPPVPTANPAAARQSGEPWEPTTTEPTPERSEKVSPSVAHAEPVRVSAPTQASKSAPPDAPLERAAEPAAHQRVPGTAEHAERRAETDDAHASLASTFPPGPASMPLLPTARSSRLVQVALAVSTLLVAVAVAYRVLAPAAAPAAPAQTPAAPTRAPSANAPAEPARTTTPATPTNAATVPTQPVPGETPGAQVQSLMEQARALEQAGKPRLAMEIYERAAAAAPNAPDVLSRLAFSYLNRGENQKASELAARAVAVDPTSSEGWIVLGAAQHALGDIHAARDAYRKCVELGKGSYVEECRRVAR
jgi:hypothetical protein